MVHFILLVVNGSDSLRIQYDSGFWLEYSQSVGLRVFCYSRDVLVISLCTEVPRKDDINWLDCRNFEENVLLLEELQLTIDGRDR